MSEPLQPTLWPETELPSMSSAAGSHARTSALREMVLALKASAAASGLSMPDLLASYDRSSSSWRTSQHSLEGGLTEFSGTWPRSGLMRSGIAYQLPPLVPLTGGIDSGLLPTPSASDPQLERRAATAKAPFVSNLGLAGMVMMMWPTPTRSMHKGSSLNAMTRSSGASRLNDRLDYAVEQGNIKTGRLNPPWVAWLMGFPTEWASFAPTETP
jgi:hypothetical protein